MSAVVRFLEGQGTDHAGRTLDAVLAFDDAELERRHDFIQWLFPLPEPSRAVPGSPVLDDADTAGIRASTAAQTNLARAAERMLAFYARTAAWRAPFDHNHLRITRIIRSLRLLAGDAAADAFRDALLGRVEAGRIPINATSLRFWREA